MMDPMPPLNRAFSMVAQFKTQSGLCVEIDDTSVMINAVERKKTYGRGYNLKLCTYCGKTGHTVETCYKKHGFPPASPSGEEVIQQLMLLSIQRRLMLDLMILLQLRKLLQLQL